MKIAISYADTNFRNAQIYNSKSAYKKGKFDKVIEFSPENIDESFRRKYKHILNQKRGGGYWLWKPYIINRALEIAEEGDYICYSDSGSYYINSIDYLIDELENSGKSIISFALPFLEVEYSKRDIFESFEMWNEEEKVRNQRLATFILLKKSQDSVEFIKEYLKYATSDSLITDFPSVNQPEDDRFIESRHDQSIFSLLCKKRGIPAYREPSEYGTKPLLYKNATKKSINEIQVSLYPQIVVSHRKKTVNLDVKVSAFIRRYLPVSFCRQYNLIRDSCIKFFR